MISEKDIKKLGDLARISLSSEELRKMPEEISSILEYVGQIDKVVSSGMVAHSENLINVLREDKDPHSRGIHTEEILQGAPERDGNYLKVKKIL